MTNLATCILCKASVPRESQDAHLALNHAAPAGGFKFWFDARPYFTDKPSMLVAELKKLAGADASYAFFEQDLKTQHDRGFSDAEAVDLTREPRFYAVPPATF